ncbi:hypothetical protein NQ540_08300 [Granulicatella adiacens ATCC 49175]|uniref:Fungal lipase-like domain-containing protein n=1 Tax=Granulicatella adiacens ATCC 49175 TaxID=638301 RepID=C8NI94_9LACT|nr:hypothetical protein [Granulicatella adiacens]EEW36650.1 hypothetical protein HMPREF0444_1639 [Granulicatella adiacens ATCC 49175]UAK93117.1 hypothetical protein K8O88_06285 [Granulicatella adiacens]UWP37892.1 hypothetical protein NQ540_08300 [Granulicatella adiacens ATCC 49175]
MGKVQETGSLIPSLDGSNLSYEFEKERITNPNETDNSVVIKNVDERKKVPDNLEYLDDFYDKITGTSGTAFRDKNTGKIIVSYTGTNLDGNAGEDIYADASGIFLGTGFHYKPAFEFYEKLAEKYGSENLIPTGHSLGGNVAMRVALRYNSKMAIVYNPAPLYMKGIQIKISPIVSQNINQINEDIANYTGRIVRIVAKNDPLTNTSENSNGVFVGDKFTLPILSGHGLDLIVENAKQVAKILRIINAEEQLVSTIEMVSSRMQSLKKRKRSFANSNSISLEGVTSSQLIYLDAMQAQTLSEGLINVSTSSLELIEHSGEGTQYKAQSLYDSLTNSNLGLSLSPDELLSAFAEAGVHYDSIVGEISRRCSDKEKEVRNIVDAFNRLKTNLDTGIQALIEKDKELENMFTLEG